MPRWGTRKAGEIRKRDVVVLLDQISDRGHKYARNRMQSLVSKIFNFGIRRDAVDHNPAHGIEREEEKPRKRPLTDDELRLLLPLFRAEGLAGLGFRLLLLTGQRPSEVFGMRWSEIRGDIWALPKERCKNRRSKHAPDVHLVPLSRQAREVMNELRAYGLARPTKRPEGNASEFVFPSRQHGKPYAGYQDAAQRVKAGAKLATDWEIYDLRSTVITGVKALAFPPHVQSAIANHILDSVTAAHYAAGTYEPEKRAALDAWGAHVEALDPSTIAEVVELLGA
jgi:integrase